MSSKTMKRMVIILAALLVCAIAGYLIADGILKKQEQAVADEEASMHLFSFDPNSIDKVTLDTKEGHFQMEIVDSTWAITDSDYPHEFVLNSAYVSTVCSYLSELTALTKFESAEASLADYGLEDPVVLTCSAGGTDYVLHVGNATPTREYFYAMVPGNDTVFGIDYEYGSVFYGDTSYLKSPYMLNYYDVDIAEMLLEREGEIVFDLVQKDHIWTMQAPLENGNIDSAQVNSMLSSLVRIRVEGFVGLTSEGISLKNYGLDKPYASLTVRSTDGSETIVDFAPYDVNDGTVYVLFRNEQEVATMMQGDANFINTKLSELMNENIMQVDFNQTAAVDAVVDDLTFHMEMDAASETYSIDGIDISTMGKEVSSEFRAVFDTMSNLKFEELDLTSEVDVTAEPAVVFHYTMQDGTERELSLIEAEDSLYFALVDGEYTGMTVRRRSLSGSTGVLTFHERLMDAIADAQADES